MRTRRLALAFVAFGTTGLLTGQSSTKSQTISVSVLVTKEHVASPEDAAAVVTVRNVSQYLVVETGSTDDFRLHLEGPQGEPARTEWYRKLLAGELPVTLPNFPREIPPGSSVDRTFRLSSFYDLRTPGKYTVYLEVHDASGAWIKTNKAGFEMLSQ